MLGTIKRVRRLVVGVGVVALAVLLTSMMNGWFGGGGGAASRGGVSLPALSPSADPAVTPVPPAPTEDVAEMPPAEVLEVAIDEESYFLARPRQTERTEPRSVPLAEIVALAKAAPGDRLGIRVRITRRSTARPTAETALMEALRAEGITPDAVLIRDGFRFEQPSPPSIAAP